MIWDGIKETLVVLLVSPNLLAVIVVSSEMFYVGALVPGAKDLATGPTLIPVTVLHIPPVDPSTHTEVTIF